MKILYIADLNSILVKRLIQEIILNENEIRYSIIDIFRGKIFSPKGLLNHPIISDTLSSRQKKIRIIRSVFLSAFIILFHSRYDIIHIHYLNSYYRFFLPLLRNKAEKLIITLYGSDFYHL